MSVDLQHLRSLLERSGYILPLTVCGEKRGGCQCGNIWSEPLDAPVSSGMSASQREMGGEGFTDDGTHANALLLAHAANALPTLLAIAEASQKGEG